MFTEGNSVVTTDANKEDTTEFYLDLTEKLWIICPPIIIIGGTIGNVLSIMVASRKDLRSSTVSFFLKVLAVVDTLSLWIGLTRQWLRHTFDVDVRLFSNPVCKLHKFLVYWNGHNTAIVLTVMTIERFITICFPYQTTVSITKKKLACALFSLSFAASCLNSHYWWTYSLYEKNTIESTNVLLTTPYILIFTSEVADLGKQENVTSQYIITHLKCSYGNSNYNDFVTVYWQWINLAVYSIIPFLIITIFNLLLLIRLSYSVYERKKNLGHVINTFQIGGSSLLLISAGLLYLFCTGPIAIFHIFEHIWKESHEPEDPYVEAYRSLWRSILENISYLTNALNLLVYCISGSRFRKELILMMTCKSAESESKPLDKTICKSA